MTEQQTAIEWVGGLASLPSYVTGEGAPYRPEVLFWMGAGGAVLGHALGRPGELIAQVCQSLQQTIERPIFGEPHTPQRVRVATIEIAEALRAGQLGIEVVCAPTPEFDAVLAMMGERMSGAAEAERSYLSPDIDPAAVGAFFRAAAGLFRAQPWLVVPSDQSVISVTIEQLELRTAALSVIGQLGENLGFILFSGLDDFESYVAAAVTISQGAVPELPPHLALNFERGAEVEPELRKEIVQQGWEVAGADAYPWLAAIDEDLVARRPTAHELTIAAAIALALPVLLMEKQALQSAWDGSDVIERRLSVSTHAGEVAVSLRVPYE